MAKTSKTSKTTHAAPATSEVIPENVPNEQSEGVNQESQISENQENILSGADTQEGNAPDAEYQVTAEDVVTSWESGALTSEQLKEYVDLGVITEEQREELDPTVSTSGTAKEPNPAIEAMKRQEEVNRAAIAAGKQPTETRPEVSQETRDREEIRHKYMPNKPLIDAASDAREANAQIANNNNEIEGTLNARLTRDLADMGYAYLKDPTLLKDSKVVSISIDESMENKLIAVIKEKELLGKEELIPSNATVMQRQYDPETKEPVVDDEGNEVMVSMPINEALNAKEADRVSPYSGKSAANIRLCARKACLVLMGHKTNVQYGYIRKTETSGKRFTTQMTFLSRDQIAENDLSGYYEAVCVPENVVFPKRYTSEKVSQDEYVLRPVADNDSTTLRYLNDDWAFALYRHFLANEKLAFDVGPTKGKFPSGKLLRAAPQNRTPVQPQGEDWTPSNFAEFTKAAESDQVKAFNKIMTDLKEARVAAIAAPTSENFASHLTTLANMLRDKDVIAKVNTTSLAVAIQIGRIALHAVASKYKNEKPPQDIARELVAIDREDIFGSEGRVRYMDSTGLHYWFTENDHNAGALGTNQVADKATEVKEQAHQQARSLVPANK